jgi:hypothetical protein
MILGSGSIGSEFGFEALPTAWPQQKKTPKRLAMEEGLSERRY